MTDITVLMTVYNGMPFLPMAIESILKQTFSDFKFVIVDDCSTDTSRSIIRNYKDPRIRLVINEKNIGQTRSLNRGLTLIGSEWVARMDADDISHKRRLELQIHYLRKNKDIAAVGTHLRTINPGGNVIGFFQFPEQDLPLRWMQLFTCPVSCGAVMFKTSIIRDKLGGFDSTVRYAQDWELWSRVLPNYRLANVQEYLMDVREHPGASSTSSNRVMQNEQFRINRLNPGRILGFSNNSEEWLKKVDTLRMKRVKNPEDRLYVINSYFERFRQLYPNAVDDPIVMKILAQQYLKLIYHSDIRNLPRTIRKLIFTWAKHSLNFREFPHQCLISMNEIPRHLKYWIGRNIFRHDM